MYALVPSRDYTFGMRGLSSTRGSVCGGSWPVCCAEVFRRHPPALFLDTRRLPRSSVAVGRRSALKICSVPVSWPGTALFAWVGVHQFSARCSCCAYSTAPAIHPSRLGLHLPPPPPRALRWFRCCPLGRGTDRRAGRLHLVFLSATPLTESCAPNRST